MNKIKTTRDRIVEVAKGVFSHLSVYKTTMDDIAKASKLGRRTLYTYFSSKEELYSTVVNDEISLITDKLIDVRNSNYLPKRKLVTFFYQHKKSVRDLARNHPAVRDDFLPNPIRLNKIRKDLDQNEIRLLKEILEEGIEQGEFMINDPDLLAVAIQYSIKSFEVIYIKDHFSRYSDRLYANYIRVLLKGISREK